LKCPYNRKSLQYVRKTTNDLANEETGVIKSTTEVVQEEYELMPCIKEDCGVFVSGKCNYYTASDESNS
jgi:hypothetical protein